MNRHSDYYAAYNLEYVQKDNYEKQTCGKISQPCPSSASLPLIGHLSNHFQHPNLEAENQDYKQIYNSCQKHMNVIKTRIREIIRCNRVIILLLVCCIVMFQILYSDVTPSKHSMTNISLLENADIEYSLKEKFTTSILIFDWTKKLDSFIVIKFITCICNLATQ